MSINGISGFSPLMALQASSASARTEPPASATKPEGPAFSERLGGAIKGLANAQTEASEAAKAFELGQTSDLAGVMVSQQVSSLGFQLAVNVRNKALGAYRDIMNMPV